MRMIERAAGQVSGQVPHTPKPFRWAVPWGVPAPDVGSSAMQLPATGPDVHFRSDFHPVLSASDLPTSSTAEMVPSGLPNNLSAGSGEYHKPAAPQVPQQDFEDNSSHALNSVVVTPVTEHPLVPSQPTYSSARSDLGRTTLAANNTEIEPTQAMEVPAIVVNHPPSVASSCELSSPDFPAIAEGAVRAGWPRSTTPVEPIVEVNIGRVEVRLDAPQSRAPKPVSRAQGFGEFEALRRYTTAPWPSRRR